MTTRLRTALIAALVIAPALASAQGSRDPRARPSPREPLTTGSLFTLTPPVAYDYDTGSDNDKHPERPRSQQGGGQQTGGPARNLIPGDSLHFGPR